MSKVLVELTTDDGIVLSREYDLDMTSGTTIGEVIETAEEFLDSELNLKVSR